MTEQPHLILLTSTRGSVWQRSIGAYQVAHNCRINGFNVQVIDFTDFFELEELYKVFDKLVTANLLAIGYSSTFYSRPSDASDKDQAWIPIGNLDRRGDAHPDSNLVKLFDYARSKNNNIKIIAGGANSWQMVSNPVFDAVFHGYSEDAVVDYLKHLQSNTKRLWPKEQGKDIINGDLYKFDVEKINHRWTDNDIVMPGETLPIEIARGCIFKCRFCSYPLNGKKKLDYLRDVEEIKQELLDNYDRWGTTNYFFTDDTFNDSTFKLEQLNTMLSTLPFKIKFVCYLRADLLYAHPEQIKLLKDMGLGAAIFGVETFNHKAAKAVGKGMDPDRMKELLLDLYYKHWDKSISISCSMIVGLPGETEEDLRASRQWFAEHNPAFNENWWPLKITTEGHYKSEFDTNWSKWGYTLDNEGNWTSSTLDTDRAYALSKEFNDQGYYGANSPGSWLLFSLLSYGYTLEELKTWRNDSFPWKTLVRKKLRMVREYKKLLFNCLDIT